jgi:hypothetical protein
MELAGRVLYTEGLTYTLYGVVGGKGGTGIERVGSLLRPDEGISSVCIEGSRRTQTYLDMYMLLRQLAKSNNIYHVQRPPTACPISLCMTNLMQVGLG